LNRTCSINQHLKKKYKYKHFLTLAAPPPTLSLLCLSLHPPASHFSTLPSPSPPPTLSLLCLSLYPLPPTLSLLCISLTLPSAFDFPPLPYGFGSFGF